MKKQYMDIAFEEAKKSYDMDEIPVGCVIVKNDQIIAIAHNHKECKKNAIMNAELLAIDMACKAMGSWRLDDCELYTTLEPCMMCMGAIIESRINTIYYGTTSKSKQMYDINKIKTENLKIVNICDKRCSIILSEFFKNKRKN